MSETKSEITFSFGENWKDYISRADESAITAARDDIRDWIPESEIKGKRVIDVGCGSGIHSLAYFTLEASEIISIDYDPSSVEATTFLWERSGKPDHWKVMHGSALDSDFLEKFGQFDIVYSWGVLHHTGEMWKAIGNVLPLCKPGGYCWISIYVKGPNFQRDLERKRNYNKAGNLIKRWMEFRYFIFPLMYGLLRAGKNPFRWNRQQERGMNTYYDIRDWLGGLPYEVASKEEIISFFEKDGFTLERIREYPEGSCNVYLFRKK